MVFFVHVFVTYMFSCETAILMYVFVYSLMDNDWQYQIWKWGVIFTDNVRI